MNLYDLIIKEPTLKRYFIKCTQSLDFYHKDKNVYPPKHLAFSALKKVKITDLKVVIIGQDPYHQKGQANGLAFSVNSGVKIPKSLINIFKEIENNFDITMQKDGDLSYLAKQGVLLWNVFLSVADSKPLSHANSTYSELTNELIKFIDLNFENVIFLLWGKKAQEIENLLVNSHVLKSSHPSPLSCYRGFNGCKHFKKTNALLKSFKKTEINWGN